MCEEIAESIEGSHVRYIFHDIRISLTIIMAQSITLI